MVINIVHLHRQRNFTNNNKKTEQYRCCSVFSFDGMGGRGGECVAICRLVSACSTYSHMLDRIERIKHNQSRRITMCWSCFYVLNTIKSSKSICEPYTDSFFFNEYNIFPNKRTRKSCFASNIGHFLLCSFIKWQPHDLNLCCNEHNS